MNQGPAHAARIQTLYAARACSICEKYGPCAHREPRVEAAILSTIPKPLRPAPSVVALRAEPEINHRHPNSAICQIARLWREGKL